MELRAPPAQRSRRRQSPYSTKFSPSKCSTISRYPLIQAGILLDREEPTAGPLEPDNSELNVADAEVWSRARDPRAVFTIRVGLRVDPGERTAFGAAAAAWGSGDLASPL